MQRWEYAFLQEVDDERLALTTPTERHVRDASWWEQWWAKLGDEGWEFVAATGGQYIFKRPKGSAP